jgi:hypothetical protein
LRSCNGGAPEGFTIEMKKVEQAEDEGFGAARVGCSLYQTEGSDAVGADAAQLSVGIGLPDGK